MTLLKPTTFALFSTLFIIIFSLSCFSYDAEKDIERFVAMSEDEIDIGIVAITLSKEIYPDVDIKTYSRKIDLMAYQIKAMTGGESSPDWRIRVMNTYLYQINKLSYDMTDINATKRENRFIKGILDKKIGSCVTMPLLYVAIAQRLGYPVYPVPAADHLFLRYEAGRVRKNIEATGGGGYSSDEEYIFVGNISKNSIKSGAYMRTLTYKEYLADLIAENAIYWAVNDNIDRAIRYLEKCVKIAPRNADIWATLAEFYLVKINSSNERTGFEKWMSRREYCRKKAISLGVLKRTSGNYLAEQEQRQNIFRRTHKNDRK